MEQKKRSLKKFITCTGIVAVLVFLCLVVFALLWISGFFQNSICSNVKVDSALGSRFNCGANQQVTIEGEKYNYQESPSQTIITSEEELLTSVIEKASPAVVGIGIKGNEDQPDSIIGTGFIVTTNGLIVTNRHVVEDEEADYFVNLKDSKEAIEVTEVFRDPVNDIALVRIAKDNLSALVLGDSDKLKQGQTVIAIGNPLGKFSGTVTSGIISGLNREVLISKGFFGGDIETYQDVIQTDAAINPGNSGGPLLNSDGTVIGVNFATVEGADNLSFALPINRIKTRIEELNTFGKFRLPYIGVEYRSRIVFLGEESARGAQLTRVVSDSPADKSGLKVGDVVVQFNGEDLTEKSLFALIQQTKIGDEVSVNILRNRKPLEVKIIIGERD